MKFLQNKSAFTLAELMAVVVILAILTAIGIGAYRQAAERSHFNEGYQMGSAIAGAIERFHDENLTLSSSARKKPTMAQLDITFPSMEASHSCVTASEAEQPYCVKGRHFEAVYSYDSAGGYLYVYRVRGGERKDYYIRFMPQFPDNIVRALEVCVVTQNSANGKETCKAMGYTEQVSETDSAITYRKPYGAL